MTIGGRLVVWGDKCTKTIESCLPGGAPRTGVPRGIDIKIYSCGGKHPETKVEWGIQAGSVPLEPLGDSAAAGPSEVAEAATMTVRSKGNSAATESLPLQPLLPAAPSWSRSLGCLRRQRRTTLG